LRVLPEIAERSLDESPDLGLNFIDCSSFLRQSHPTRLDGLADDLIDVPGAEEGLHIVRALVVGNVNARFHLLSLCNLNCE
jgi:hypothetical protein